MPTFGPTSRANLIHCFRRLGFLGPYSGGKHQFMVKGQLRVRIPNPHGDDIGKNLLRAVLREAGISLADWESI